MNALAEKKEALRQMARQASEGSDEIREDRARRAERAALFLDTPGRQAPEEEDEDREQQASDDEERQALRLMNSETFQNVVAHVIVDLRAEWREEAAALRAEIAELKRSAR